MATRKLTVEIVGDSKSLERAFTRSSSAATGFNRDMTTTGKKLDKVAGGFTALQRSFAGAFAAGAAVAAIKNVTDAAARAQIVLGQTSVAVDDAGLSWADYATEVQNAALSISRTSAFDDEEILQSFAVFVRGQKDVAKSLELSRLAADVARGRYTNLAAATQLVNKAALGQIGALRRAGIQIDANATSTEALTALTAAYGGAAVRYSNSAAGAQDKLRVSVENLKEELGSGLLPVLTNVVGFLNESVGAAQTFSGALRDLGIRGSDVGNALKAAFVATPGLQLVIGETKILNGLFGHTKETLDNVTAAAKAFGDAFGVAALQAFQATKKVPAFGEPGFKPGQAPAVPLGPSVQQRNQIFDNAISRAVFRNQSNNDAQELAGLKKIEGQISARIAITKDITRRLKLEDDLITVQRQEQSLRESIRSDAATRLQNQRSARIEKEQAALAGVTSRQFRELGLGADGNAVTPGVANLRKRIGSFEANVKGTFLDTNKTRTQLARFRKVLSEALVPKDVRSKMDELLRDLSQKLNSHAKTGPLTKTTSLNSTRILAGLGLSRTSERQLRSRLSQFNSAGVGLAGRAGTAGAFGVDVYLDGQKISTSTRRHNTVHARSNPKQRRGRRR